MDSVWRAHLIDNGHDGRRTCLARSADGHECGARYSIVRGQGFRWWHVCTGLLYDGPTTVYTGLVHGRWFSCMSLFELDRFADNLPAPPPPVDEVPAAEVARSEEPIATVTDLTARRAAA